jgi:hypothetical protein
MKHLLRRPSRLATIAALVVTLGLGVAPAALGDDWARDRVAADAVQGLDPAISTAIAARAAEPTRPVTSSPLVASVSATGGDEFAWRAAAIGLGAGIAAMCLLLGCVTLVRSHGRLRSV